MWNSYCFMSGTPQTLSLLSLPRRLPSNCPISCSPQTWILPRPPRLGRRHGPNAAPTTSLNGLVQPRVGRFGRPGSFSLHVSRKHGFLKCGRNCEFCLWWWLCAPGGKFRNHVEVMVDVNTLASSSRKKKEHRRVTPVPVTERSCGEPSHDCRCCCADGMSWW